MATGQRRQVNPDGSLGATFWLALVGGLILVAIGVMIAVFAFGAVWSNRGFLAAVVIFVALACGVAWVTDRRQR
jgi:hypothetical protein